MIKRMRKLIEISKSEKTQLLKKYPSTHIVRTMRQKSKRHHYYVVEDPHVVSYLSEIRKENIVEAHGQ